MHDVEIRALSLPSHWDEQSAHGAAFRAANALQERINAAWYGEGVMALTPAERLAAWQSNAHERLELVTAHDAHGRLLAIASLWVPLTESTETAEHELGVDPALPAEARRAILGALLEAAEARCRELGRTTIIGGSRAAATGAVVAATGSGGAEPEEPEAAVLIERGYRLEQVYRVSVADVRDLGDLDDRLARARAGAAGYDVLAWAGETPTEHRRGIRMLHERMSVDAPIGGLDYEPETWSDERLATFERSKTAGGRTMRTVVARHRESGELVGFSSLFVGSGDTARQHDTLVVREHRGNGLGMLLKLANLVELRDNHPGHPRVSTWNAEENRHMLRVNEATGFRAIAHVGVWQRKERS